jgi:hypothetical protein
VTLQTELIKDAVYASVYVEPAAHGLTHDELLQVAERLGVPHGTASASIESVYRGGMIGHDGSGRLVLRPEGYGHHETTWPMFKRTGDRRNPAAYDAIDRTLQKIVADVGEHAAALTRDVLLARVIQSSGIAEEDIQAAVTFMRLGGQLIDDGDKLRLAYPHAEQPSRVQQYQRAYPKPQAADLGPIFSVVTDVIRRRQPGVAKHPEPVIAFEKHIASLGKDYEYFAQWWRFLRNELALMTEEMPTARITHLAALAEGALALVVEKGRSVGGSMSEKLNPDDPTQWKFQHLIAAAKTGKPAIIKDEALAQECLTLNRVRQRIHAGRLLAERGNYPLPDAKPEEARQAKATTDKLIRAVLEWLEAIEPKAS